MKSLQKWENWLETLEQLLDRFMVNRKYRERSFHSDAEYMVVQEAIAADVESLEKEIGREVEEVVHTRIPRSGSCEV